MTELAFDTYLSLCTQVYDLSKPSPPDDAYKFYRSYVASTNGHILEPMCGTGRFLLPLVAEGFDVQGFDASKHMLDALHEKAQTKNNKLKVWQDTIEDVQLTEKYQLIFIPSGSFCLIIDFNHAKQALKKIFNHLADDGVFVFESITPHWKTPLLKVWTGDVWYRNDGKYIIHNSCTLPDHDNIRHSISRYELVDGNRIIQVEMEDFKVRLYDQEQLYMLLRKIGFNEIEILKAFDRDKPAGNSDEEIVYECRK